MYALCFNEELLEMLIFSLDPPFSNAFIKCKLKKPQLEHIFLSPAGDEGKKKHVSCAKRILQTRVNGRRRRTRALEGVKSCPAADLLRHVILM